MEIKVKFELYHQQHEDKAQELDIVIDTSMDPHHWDEMSSEDRYEYITDVLWEECRTHIIRID